MLRALRLTALLLLAAAAVVIAATALIGVDGWDDMDSRAAYILIAVLGAAAAAWLALAAWRAANESAAHALGYLLLAYCALLIGPASQVYRQVDRWQNLAKISVAIKQDAAGRPLILLAPDETTRAIIDMYARTSLDRVPGPIDAAVIDRVRAQAAAAPDSVFLVLVPGRVRGSSIAVGARAARRGGAALAAIRGAGNSAELLAAPWPALRVAAMKPEMQRSSN